MRYGETGTFRMSAEINTIFIRHITFFNKLFYVHFARTFNTSFPAQFILQCCLISCFHIKIANPTVISTRQSDTHHVGSHPGNILAGCNTITQPTSIFIHQQLTVYKVIIIFRICQCPKRSKVPVSSPNRIRIIMIMFRFAIFI